VEKRAREIFEKDSAVYEAFWKRMNEKWPMAQLPIVGEESLYNLTTPNIA
jgi:hypothetical protein